MDISIDLGTANVLVYVKGKGIVLREPSVVAVDKDTNRVLAIGEEARRMIGRTPGNIVAIRPLREGVIADYDITESMLRHFIEKVVGRSFVFRPRIMICIPSGCTMVEQRAVQEAAEQAGARHTQLIEEPLAAALGAGLDIVEPCGSMIVDIGGGTTDIGVVSMNGIANSASLKIAGIEFDNAIIRYVRRNYGLVIGQNAAEDAKLAIGCVIDRPEPVKTEVKGRDIKTGLARQIELTGEDMREALKRPARMICDKVLEVLEQTTPELVSDSAQNGIVLTGGGSQIWGMDKLLEQRTAISCMLADDADSCVAYGCGKSLTWINHMTEGTINIARKRLLKE